MRSCPARRFERRVRPGITGRAGFRFAPEVAYIGTDASDFGGAPALVSTLSSSERAAGRAAGRSRVYFIGSTLRVGHNSGQGQSEHRAVSGLALDRQLAAHQMAELAREREPSAAVLLSRARGLDG